MIVKPTDCDNRCISALGIKLPILLLSFSCAAHATGQSEPEEQAESVRTEPSWYDKTQSYFSDSVDGLGSYLDHGLAQPEDGSPDIANHSYMRLRMRSQYSHLGGYVSDPGIALRIDLPHTEDKWNLIFDTEPDDHQNLESKQRDTIAPESITEEQEMTGTVRVEESWLDHWRRSFDVGIKLHMPLDPFTRAEIWRVGNATETWSAEFRQQIFYYNSKGAGLYTRLNFYHALNQDESQIVSISSSAQYLYDPDRWELLNQVKLTDRINHNHLLEYSTGVSIDPREDDEMTNYWISLSWQQNLYKHWLFLNITPQIDVPRSYDYKVNPGIMITLEAYFSRNKKFDLLARSIPKSTRN